MLESRVKKTSQKKAYYCDFNSFATTTLKFLFLSLPIIYYGITNKMHLLKFYNNVFTWNY